MKLIIWIVSLAALGLALAIAVAGPGVRLGLWEYPMGFTIIRNAAMPVAIAAVASGLGFVAALFVARGVAIIPLIAAIAAGTAALVPVKMKEAVDAHPFIHDITTDFDNPPPIVKGADAERKNPPEYVGDEAAPRSELTVAEAQRAAFPDIEPFMTAQSVDEAAQRAAAVIEKMGMTLIAEGPTESGGRLIEAKHTSLWFGFIDDFIVRIEPAGEGARIDVRSKSRVGGSDLGANAKRVRAFMEKYRAAES
ncbi:MAG: DUF1499 domain-containing protein [Pseudomonadota bacterium]